MDPQTRVTRVKPNVQVARLQSEQFAPWIILVLSAVALLPIFAPSLKVLSLIAFMALMFFNVNDVKVLSTLGRVPDDRYKMLLLFAIVGAIFPPIYLIARPKYQGQSWHITATLSLILYLAIPFLLGLFGA